jgi:hypothetical protein
MVLSQQHLYSSNSCNRNSDQDGDSQEQSFARREVFQSHLGRFDDLLTNLKDS